MNLSLKEEDLVLTHILYYASKQMHLYNKRHTFDAFKLFRESL